MCETKFRVVFNPGSKSEHIQHVTLAEYKAIVRKDAATAIARFNQSCIDAGLPNPYKS